MPLEPPAGADCKEVEAVPVKPCNTRSSSKQPCHAPEYCSTSNLYNHDMTGNAPAAGDAPRGGDAPLASARPKACVLAAATWCCQANC